MKHFDTDNLTPCSAAARELAKHEEHLTKVITAAREAAEDQAAKMTKAELATALGTDGKRAAQATKAELVKRYADRAVRETPESAELLRLKQEAGRDRMVASRLNDAADDYEMLAAKFRDATDLAYTVEWHGDDMIAAKYLLRYAEAVRTATTRDGKDLREAVLDVAHSATYHVFSFARNGSSLRVGGHGMEDAAQARAAADFMRIATWVLGDTVPVSLITQ